MSPDGESIGRALRTAASHSNAAPSPGISTRRAVAQGLRHHDSAVTVTELARRLDLHANTVRNHLDSLADDGLVERSQRRSGRRGRPSTVYAPLSTGLLPLEELSAELTAALDACDASAIAKTSARAWKPARTQAAAEPDEAVDHAVEVLRDIGFDASRNRVGDEITMTNCPYASLFPDHPEICAIHAELIHNTLSVSGQPVSVKAVDVWVRPGMCRARLNRADVSPRFTVPSHPVNDDTTAREEP
ncbi:helix-turn-helix transcriptional regulator [Demequina globuliformis]|uniref:helix-turn-helix transcriptional regulator n=1 Tax=Demequina globuliformis TaxID=676202 RepID=UPI000786737B|nr:helix-turn-helix domain-containing protein [Demequina globuliformis]